MTLYYDQGGIQIWHADCRDVLPLLGPVDLVLTDPPYGMGKDFANDTPEEADRLIADVLPDVRRLARSNALMFWSAQRMDVIYPLFQPKRVMIWNKDWAIYTPHNVGYRYEPIVWICGDGATRKRGDIFECFPIIRVVQAESVGHPTQKPEHLIREIIEDFSPPGATVLDLFAGSGTTLRAAKDLGRKAIGIEIEERYCEIAARRLSQEVMNFEVPV